MQYGILQDGAIPKHAKPSPARSVAGHLVTKFGRPSRFRTRMLFTLVAMTVTFCLFFGRTHVVEIQRTATTLSSYIPDSIAELADVIAQYGDLEDIRWDDDVEGKSGSKISKKPKFHLLVPTTSKPTANLCKTLLSAAILNYPPPTLISYGEPGGSKQPGGDVVANTYKFLKGKEAHDEDLILIVEEDTWFQLPAEVTINRFFHGMRDSSAKLLEQYGRTKSLNASVPKSDLPPKYTQKVLFGSAKECSNYPSDAACSSVPHSPLPKDIYGSETDRHAEGKYNRPRYMSSSMVMGTIKDLRPIYKRATEMLESIDTRELGSQYIFSQIFGEQEHSRTLSQATTEKPSRRWQSWLTFTLLRSEEYPTRGPNVTLQANQSYEYGIGLDYISSVFQVINNSAEDIRFVRFDHPSVIASPSKLSASSFKNPIHLPPDLGITHPPFGQHKISSPKPDPPITELDNMTVSTNASWAEIELATNVIVPGSSVPAALNFHGNEELLEKLWEKMWYWSNARALLRQYIRSPDGPIAAEAAAEGGDRWWDLRGGKGGVWTDRGEWLEWNEVCGEFDDVVFGDGKGEFGTEREEVGGQRPVYKFGQLIAGKLSKKPKPEPAAEEILAPESPDAPVGSEFQAQDESNTRSTDSSKEKSDIAKKEKERNEDGASSSEEAKNDKVDTAKPDGEGNSGDLSTDDEVAKKDDERKKDEDRRKNEQRKKDGEEEMLLDSPETHIQESSSSHEEKVDNVDTKNEPTGEKSKEDEKTDATSVPSKTLKQEGEQKEFVQNSLTEQQSVKEADDGKSESYTSKESEQNSVAITQDNNAVEKEDSKPGNDEHEREKTGTSDEITEEPNTMTA